MKRPVLAGLLVAVACIWLGPGTALAQSPSSVSGQVVDAATGVPVEGAVVRLGSIVVVTGTDGRFNFGTTDPGRRLLTVRRIGFEPTSLEFEVLQATAHRQVVSMAPLPVQLDSLVILAAPTAPTIGNEELRRRGRTLGAALDGWEGITIRPGSDGAAAPTLRGSAADEVLVLLDGFPVNDPYTGRADLRKISSAVVEEVRLHPGAQATVSGGRAIAGVIDIVTRSAGGEVAMHGGSNGTLGGLARGRVLGTDASFSGENLADGFSYPVPAVRGDGEAERVNAGGRIWAFNLRHPGATEVLIRGSGSERGLPGPVTNPTPTAHASDLSALAAVTHHGRVDAAVSFQVLAAHFEDASPPSGLGYDSRTRGLDLSLRLARELAQLDGRLAVRVGLDGGYTGYSGDNIPTDSERWRSGLSVSTDWQLSSRLALSGNSRFDWWSDLDAPVGSLRAELRASLGRTVLTAGGGSAVAAPVLADLFFREGNGVRVNPHLQPERVRWEVEAGARHTERAGQVEFVASLRGYLGWVDDLVLWGQSPGYGFAWMPRNFDVQRRGAELSLGLRPSPGLSLSASGTFSQITRPWADAPQLPYRPLYTVAVTTSWDPGPVRLDGRWHLVSERNRDYRGVNQLPSYALLGFGLELAPGAGVTLRADVEDLFNRQPAYIAGYPSVGRTLTATISYELP